MPPFNLLLLSAGMLIASVLNAQPLVSSIETDQQGRTILSGNGFGKECGRCEVIVDYGRDLRYAIPVTHWSDKRIEAHLPDLNRAINLKATVTTPGGSSTPKALRLKRMITPSKEYTKPVTDTQGGQLLTFEKTHKESLGGKGEDRFNVSVAAPSCQQQALVFDKARLVYSDRRFAEAQITALPSPGCSRCQPLKVGWYHEPTGRLTYQLHIYRRLVEGICRDRIRH